MKNLSENIPESNPQIRELFSDCYEELIEFGKRIDPDSGLVEDSIQDLFLKFCENNQLFLKVKDPKAYLKVSLKRHIIHKRKQYRGEKKAISKLVEISVPSYEEILIKKQTSLQDAIAMKKALATLTSSQKNIMTMRFYRSMSYEEIATKLDISKRTIYNQIHDAMKKLRSKED